LVVSFVTISFVIAWQIWISLVSTATVCCYSK